MYVKCNEDKGDVFDKQRPSAKSDMSNVACAASMELMLPLSFRGVANLCKRA